MNKPTDKPKKIRRTLDEQIADLDAKRARRATHDKARLLADAIKRAVVADEHDVARVAALELAKLLEPKA